MVELAATQHCDLGCRIENREDDGALHHLERALVFRVEETRIFHRD